MIMHSISPAPLRVVIAPEKMTVGAVIGTAILAATAFPRLYRSFSSTFGTEFSVVLHSADAAPFIAVPARNDVVFGSHTEKSFAVCHIL